MNQISRPTNHEYATKLKIDTFNLIGDIPSFATCTVDASRTFKDLSREFSSCDLSYRLKANMLTKTFCPLRPHRLSDGILRFFIQSFALNLINCLFKDIQDSFTEIEPEMAEINHLHIFVLATMKLEKMMVLTNDSFFICIWSYSLCVGMQNYIELFRLNDALLDKHKITKEYPKSSLEECSKCFLENNFGLCKDELLRMYVVDLMVSIERNFPKCSSEQKHVLRLMCSLYFRHLGCR